MSGLESLYQELILEHSKRPHGKGLADDQGAPTGSITATSHQRNPICGDEITLRVRLDDADVVREVSWEGSGCSISQASASMLAVLVDDSENGMPRAQASALIDGFREALRSRGTHSDRRGDLRGCGGPERRLEVHRPREVRDARVGGVRGRSAPRRLTLSDRETATARRDCGAHPLSRPPDAVSRIGRTRRPN